MKTQTGATIRFTLHSRVATWLTSLSVAAFAGHISRGGDLGVQDILQKSRDAYAALSSYTDRGTVSSDMAGQHLSLSFNTRLQRPGQYRVDWTQSAGLSGVVWSSGDGDFLRVNPGSPPTPGGLAALTAVGFKNEPNPRKMPTRSAALAVAGPLCNLVASTVPGAFFNQDLGDVFIAPALSGRYPLEKAKDAQVGEVNCYVLTNSVDLSKVPAAGKPGTVWTTLWIGKDDFLVHQTRTRYVEPVNEKALSSDQALDDAIKKTLEMQNKPATPEAVAAMRPQMRAIMKQVQSTLKAGFTAGIVTTQTHSSIKVNQALQPADFSR